MILLQQLTPFIKKTVVLTALVMFPVVGKAQQFEPLNTDSLIRALPAMRGNTTAKADAFHLLSEHFQYEDPVQSIGYAKQALLIARELKDKASMLRAYFNLGAAQQQLSNYVPALKDFQTVFQLSKEIDYPGGMLTALLNMGLIYYAQFDYANALTFMKKALAMQSKLSNHPYDQYNLASVLTEMGRTYAAMDSLDLALEYLKKGSAVYQQHKRFEFLVHPLLGIADVKMKQRRYEEGIYHLERSLSLYQEGISSLVCNCNRADILLQLAGAYLSTKETNKAFSYTRQAQAWAVANGSQGRIIKVHKMLSQIYEARGNAADALAELKKFNALSDSAHSLQKSKQLYQVQALFEAQEREKEIESLKQRNQLQNLTAEQQRIISIAAVSGFVLVSLLMGVLLNRYRLKQKANRELEYKQHEINQKQRDLELLLTEKDTLLVDKDHLLEEKEWLMKEIHHRVKNNLQVVMSLLYLQSLKLRDNSALDAIQQSQNRVHAMALLHQQLYQGEDTLHIDAREYISELSSYLTESFDSCATVKLDVARVELDVSQAVPLGLIINEAVTNALKYAFPAGQAGVIQVEFRQTDRHTYSLVVRDNGVGLPVDFDPLQSHSLGINLINRLAQQLDGQLSIEGHSGVSIRVVFNAVKTTQRYAKVV